MEIKKRMRHSYLFNYDYMKREENRIAQDKRNSKVLISIVT